MAPPTHSATKFIHMHLVYNCFNFSFLENKRFLKVRKKVQSNSLHSSIQPYSETDLAQIDPNSQ